MESYFFLFSCGEKEGRKGGREGREEGRDGRKEGREGGRKHIFCVRGGRKEGTKVEKGRKKGKNKGRKKGRQKRRSRLLSKNKKEGRKEGRNIHSLYTKRLLNFGHPHHCLLCMFLVTVLLRDPDDDGDSSAVTGQLNTVRASWWAVPAAARLA